MQIARNVIELIGNTPMMRLSRLSDEFGAKIFAKVETFNPGGSIKDRICDAMICVAEENGKLKAGDTIVEPTAGNTGIGLSIVGIAKGYKVVLTMPENMSKEKHRLLTAFGAELILTPEDSGMAGAIWEAEELVRRKSRHFMPNQFTNPANPEAHRKTTGAEILTALSQPIDFFVAGVGTGGTLTGVAQALKQKWSKTKIVAVEPKASAVLSGGVASPTRIDGIGAGMIPEILDVNLIDRVMTVSDEEAYNMMRQVAHRENLLVGMSAGANVHASLELAKNLDRTKTIVTILPDSGERYLSLSEHFESDDDLELE